jgi:hypothetical protein
VDPVTREFPRFERPDYPAGRSREYGPDGFARRPLNRYISPVGLHHPQDVGSDPFSEPFEIIRHQARDIGVNDRRAAPFVLSILRKNLVRGRNIPAARATQEFLRYPFVVRIGVRIEKTDRDRLDSLLLELLTEGHDRVTVHFGFHLTVRSDPLLQPEPIGPRHQRERSIHHDIVNPWPGLPSDFDNILEPAGSHQRGPGTFSLEKGVRGHGRTVNAPVNGTVTDKGLEPVDNRLRRIIRCGGDLVGPDFTVEHGDKIRKCSTRVDSNPDFAHFI